jgi:hypothetical protein
MIGFNIEYNRNPAMTSTSAILVFSTDGMPLSMNRTLIIIHAPGIYFARHSRANHYAGPFSFDVFSRN